MSQSVDTYVGAGTGKVAVTWSVTLATLTDAAQWHWTPGFNGRLTKVTFVTHTPATTAGKLTTLTPSIAGTNVTGGVLALTTAAANTRDKALAGTTITGNNSFTSTQTITLTASSTTAFTEGSGEVQIEAVNDDTRKGVAMGSMGLTYN
jgi:hypothetical protein